MDVKKNARLFMVSWNLSEIDMSARGIMAFGIGASIIQVYGLV